MGKKKFRTGQRSVYDPQRIFRIDRSVLPERIFHEKGTDRWFTRSELLAIGEGEKPPAMADAATLRHAGTMRSHAFRGASGAVLAVPEPVQIMPERKCQECGTPFHPRRR